ncbi:MAG: hypothetical protein AAGD01_04735 [Acidobacteriota bacterium]
MASSSLQAQSADSFEDSPVSQSEEDSAPALEGPYAPLGGGAPFGLHRGSSLEDVESLVGLLSPVSEQDYMAVQIPGSPPLLETLTLTVTPEDGLCRLRASTALLQDPGDGSVVLDAFERLRAPLEQAFGELHTTLDTLLPDSPYAAADQWLAGLRHRHRALLMLWNRESGSALPDSVEHISLAARGYSDREGFLVLEYTFTNWSACEARRVADQAIE